MDWSSKLDQFGEDLLKAIGKNPNWLPVDHNPVTEALKDPNFIERMETRGILRASTCRMGLSRAATICQMVVYDHQNGPEEDGKLTGLREQWYRWYKVQFAQPLAGQLGDKMLLNEMGILDIDGRAWFARMSVTYGELVDTGEVTYKDLWVEDASRKMEKIHYEIFRQANIIVAVEKDGMMKRFASIAKALGAASIYSGKGKSGKAAIELLLREHFRWSEYHNPFTVEKPLIVIHISDYDYDGEAVIGPTFAEQCRRYTPHVLEARIGIEPYQIRDAGLKWETGVWYRVKVKKQSNYLDWTSEKALFTAECEECGHKWPVIGIGPHDCPCCEGLSLPIEIGKDVAHGFEVEAMYTKNYRSLMVNALLTVLPFDYIVKKLREECTADAYSTAQTITDQVCKDNKSYQSLLKEFERLEEIKQDFENKVRDQLQELGEPHVFDWENDDDDPEPDEYRGWVRDASDWAGPWRPFSKSDRTASLVKFLEEDAVDEIDGFIEEEITW